MPANQANIDGMPANWKQAFFTGGYLDHNHNNISALMALMRELLKYDKSAMAKLVS
jgi:hypothetical protein